MFYFSSHYVRHGFTVLIDNRQGAWKNIKILFKALEVGKIYLFLDFALNQL